MTELETTLRRSAEHLRGLPCTCAQNPIGSTLTMDFGLLARSAAALPKERARGEHRLTIYSPWRVQDESEVLFDWNVDGGADGLLPRLVSTLEGSVVERVVLDAPAWDLRLEFSTGLVLVVFADFDDDREVAWYITARGMPSVSARPVARTLPKRDAEAE
jgi:hypothetical protein